MSIHPGGISAQTVVTKVFGQDVIQAMEHPKKPNAESIVEGGKIKAVAHEKIFKGSLAEFKGRQDSVALSIINVAHRLAGEREIEGGDSKATEKIFKEAIKETGDSLEAKRELARDLKQYANKLMEASMHRRGELKSGVGAVDEEVFRHLGANRDQVDRRLTQQFTELKGVNALAADIERNGISNKRLSIKAADGHDITPQADNVYEFTKGILENSMRCLHMTEGPEGAFNTKAMGIIDRFNAHVAERNPQTTEAQLKNLSPDQLREAIQSFVEELKGSGDPEMNKLAFALICSNQTWVTTPGAAFNLIAREAYGHERFSGGAAVQLHSQTHFDLQFEADGSMTLRATTGFTNRDYEHIGGEDYTCLMTAEVKLDSRGSNDLKVDTQALLHHRSGHAETVAKLREAMFTAGFVAQTRGVNFNTLSQRQALAANTLIDAIRSKDLASEGVIRQTGSKADSEALGQTLIAQSNLWDPEKVLLQPQIVERTDINNLVSALKHILRDHFALIPPDRVEAFLRAGAEDAPPELMREFVATLPEEHQSVIRNLCQLCHEVVAQSEENKMTADNVGIALAPSVTPSADPMLFREQKLAFLKLLEAFPPPPRVVVEEGPAQPASSSSSSGTVEREARLKRTKSKKSLSKKSVKSSRSLRRQESKKSSTVLTSEPPSDTGHGGASSSGPTPE